MKILGIKKNNDRILENFLSFKLKNSLLGKTNHVKILKVVLIVKLLTIKQPK